MATETTFYGAIPSEERTLPPFRRRLSPRANLLLGAGILVTSFHLVYVSWLNPVYGYLGCTYPDQLNWTTIPGYLYALLPCMWMPLGLARPSQFLHWTIYLTVYFPSVLVVSFLELQPPIKVFALQCALFAGLIIIGQSYRWQRVAITRIPLNPNIFFSLLALGTLALLGRVVLVYWGHFHFVRWQDAYDIRFSGSDVAAAEGLAYPINWLSFVFLPTWMAIALVRKQTALFAAAAVCTVLLYATQGMKHILFSSVYIYAMYWLLRYRSEVFAARLIWAAAAFLAAFFFYTGWMADPHSVLALLFGANVVLRVFANAAILMGSYQAFFATHPLTYYSHVTGINWLVHYPYNHALGIEISLAAGGSENYNQNAGFWATDGLAAFGLPGVILISVFIAGVFYAFDCVTAGRPTTLVALCLSQYVIILANVSFFTSLITGGLLWFFVIFFLMPSRLVRRGSSQAKFPG